MSFSTRDDLIDIRDLIERFEELETEREDLEDALSGLIDDAGEDYDADSESEEIETARVVLTGWDASGEADELKAFGTALEYLKGSGGDHQWRGSWYPITLIRDSHFENFAQEEAESIGAINPNARWPLNHIDWEAAARELKSDYSETDLDGTTYYFRS